MLLFYLRKLNVQKYSTLVYKIMVSKETPSQSKSINLRLFFSWYMAVLHLKRFIRGLVKYHCAEADYMGEYNEKDAYAKVVYIGGSISIELGL